MALTIGQVQAELAQLRSIEGDCKSMDAILNEVIHVINNDPPIWDLIDPTAGQSDTVLAAYDALKTSLKTKVAAF